MTTVQARGIKQEDLNDSSVAEYLQTYPDFFERNGPLLTRLRLPHLRDAGSTVSLVERQVEVLPVNAISRSNASSRSWSTWRGRTTRWPDRIHRLSQRLIRAHSLLETINAVEASLREDFDAMHSVLVLFLEEAQSLEAAAGRFLRADTLAGPEIKTFESLLAAGKPRCGQIRDAQRDYLFGKDSIEIGSVALTPLGPKGALGILAIGASDADRFHPGMSTEFLSRIGELVTYALVR